MKAGALKWWISLAAIACIALTGGVAFAQNGQGLAAVGAPSPANPYPRWYMDRSGLQLGQLDLSSCIRRGDNVEPRCCADINLLAGALRMIGNPRT